MQTDPYPSDHAEPLPAAGAGCGYGSILIHMHTGQTALERLGLATHLAARFGARLIGIGAEAYAPGVFSGVGHAAGPHLAAQLEDLRGRMRQAERNFFAAGGEAPGGAAWIVEEMLPYEALALHARGADLVVATRPGRGEGENVSASPAELVMAAGAPVLLAPTPCGTLDGRRVLVGWKDTRESRRALSDALPFLRRAEEVTIMAFCQEAQVAELGLGLMEVAQRLQQHGVGARTVAERIGTGTVADQLERTAETMDADLIVVGAFGRSHVQEWTLGGVTRDLMAHSDRFILFGR